MLLIEDLDALGADVADARERAEWLTAAGARVTWFAVASPDSREPAPDAGALASHVLPRRDAGRALREASSRPGWDRVILASVYPGGGALARWLPDRAEWWPTGFAPAAGTLDPRTWLKRGSSVHALVVVDGSEPAPSSPLAWSAIDSRGPRHVGLPLWDGDLVLVPEDVCGRAGEETLKAFARLADEWSGVDLVSWGHPSERARERPRSLGIEMRVHQVGPPTRPAEHAWWRHASAAVLSGSGPMTTGLVLRALDAGCPLIWIGTPGRADGLESLLAETGAWRVAADAGEIASALEAILTRGPEVEAAITRGRALVARHDGAELTQRIAKVLGTKRPDARAAA